MGAIGTMGVTKATGTKGAAQILLEYAHVDVSFDGVPVVHDVSFPVLEGEVVCIVGESGSGKSTLVQAAMGLIGEHGLVTRGDIRYQGRSLPDLAPDEMRCLRGADLSVVFQDTLASLSPIRRIADQVHESLVAHVPLTRAESDERAAKLFVRLGLDEPERILASYPFELSGGMGQRVGIALALLPNPRILFADEPTSALDVIAQHKAIELIGRANAELGVTVVLVTHNMGIVRAIADHVLVLRAGRVEEFGEAAQVLDAPRSAYTARLIEAAPRIRAIGGGTHG